MSYRFATEVPLRWVDVDSEGIVNNAVYLSLMEQARFAYFAGLGLLQGHRVPFVLARAELQFRRPGRFGMRVRVGVKVTRLGRSSFDMDYLVWGDDHELVAGTAVLVWVDEQFRPVPLDAAVRRALQEFEGLAGEPGASHPGVDH